MPSSRFSERRRRQHFGNLPSGRGYVRPCNKGFNWFDAQRDAVLSVLIAPRNQRVWLLARDTRERARQGFRAVRRYVCQLIMRWRTTDAGIGETVLLHVVWSIDIAEINDHRARHQASHTH